MKRLTDYATFSDAMEHFSSKCLWDLMDGDAVHLNIAHEAVDRHVGTNRVAIRVAHADGSDEVITFDELSRLSSRIANWLIAEGLKKGDRVAIMLDPSLPFYGCLFGAIKAGAIAVPLFTLFGIDAIKARVEDCGAKILIVCEEKMETAQQIDDLTVIVGNESFLRAVEAYSDTITTESHPRDLAIFQYTSGTSTGVPTAVRHNHLSIVYLMAAALYGTGIRPGDNFFCPSSPAWGHGLWHGTIAPLVLGVTTGTISGKFDAEILAKALQEYRINALSAAPTHFRLLNRFENKDNFQFQVTKISYTGEPLDSTTHDFIVAKFGIKPCSMYGTTEVGAVLVNFPGASDYEPLKGALGKPMPGMSLQIQSPDGRVCDVGEVGDIAVRRSGNWVLTKDLGFCDDNGYFYYQGRADDVIISAGWTMNAIEIEDTLLKHQLVNEAAVIGVPDELRGLIPKAFIVLENPTDAHKANIVEDLQKFVKTYLSLHEFPREIEFVPSLPKTPAGKVDRKNLRDREVVGA